MAEGLFLEVQQWWDIQKELQEMGAEHGTILQRSQKGYTPDDEKRPHSPLPFFDVSDSFDEDLPAGRPAAV